MHQRVTICDLVYYHKVQRPVQFSNRYESKDNLRVGGKFEGGRTNVHDVCFWWPSAVTCAEVKDEIDGVSGTTEES
jgi:hypothetical protein